MGKVKYLYYCGMKPYALWCRLTIFASIVIICLVSYGCKKSKDESSDPLKLLTAKKWKRTNTDNNPGVNPADSGYDPVPDCMLDDSFEWKTDGTYHTTFGTVKCDDEEPANTSTPYTVDFEAMEFSRAGYKVRILELTTERLKLATTLPPPVGVTLIHMYTH
jgi:hypothetical protein